MKKMVAEIIGTAALVFFGCGAAVIAGGAGVIGGVDGIGIAGIATAFGLAIVAMAYGIGAISGCHINPAVSFGVFVSGRMGAGEMLKYWLAQFIGATIGAGILYLIVSGKADVGEITNLGQNGYNEASPANYDMKSGIIFEIVGTFLFLVTILGVTHKKAPAAVAGLAIGMALWVIHLVGIPVTGTSVNPARSFGPAILLQGTALAQLPVSGLRFYLAYPPAFPSASVLAVSFSKGCPIVGTVIPAARFLSSVSVCVRFA